jgi:DNA-binding FadR family transcriptional regulator
MSSHRLPLYAQVENVILERISDGSLPAGSRLPSEDSLVQAYAVSRTTIRAAIQSLVQRGLVEIRPRPTSWWLVVWHYRKARPWRGSGGSAWRTACRFLSTRLISRRNWDRK